MKKLAIAMASIFTVLAPVAHAAYDRYGNWHEEGRNSAPVYTPAPPREDFARVIESRPVYESSNRREECWNPRAGHYEERRETHDSNVNGTVAGAVVGGVVGHQFDNGSAGATLGGALLGGLIGNKVDKDHNSNPQDDLDYSRCRVVGDNGGRNLQGYDVRYVYNGQEFTTRMNQAPGRRIRVNENGAPLY
jgi:uncharacterized protein YcfJ